MNSRFKESILALGFVTLLAGCGAPSLHMPPGTVKTDGLFGPAATDSTSLAVIPWNGLFSDPFLQQLISEGLDRNLDLQIAVQRVREAEAYFRQGSAALLPNLSAVAEGAYNRNSESIYPNGPRESKSFQLGFESSWEIDLWGKLSSAKRAAYANLLYSDAGRKAVRTRLVADIAMTYYTLLALDARLAITHETVRKYISLAETMKVMQESGKVTGAAVMQSDARRYAAEATIPDLLQSVREAENALCLLVGRPGGTPIPRGTLETQPSAPVLRTGVPAMLLDNRPDVMEAKYLVMSAYETTKIARASFYPALSITASGGLKSATLDELFDPGTFAATVIGGLTQPIFDKRTNRTRLKVAKAQQEEAVLNFRSTLLAAGNEVQNALGSYESATAKTELRARQLEALVKSVAYTGELLTYGAANYTEVLDAQQDLLSAQLSSVDDRVQQRNAVVSLYRALGGGWR